MQLWIVHASFLMFWPLGCADRNIDTKTTGSVFDWITPVPAAETINFNYYLLIDLSFDYTTHISDSKQLVHANLNKCSITIKTNVVFVK